MKQKFIFTVCILLLTSVFTTNRKAMAMRHVKIVTIGGGAEHLKLADRQDPQKMVDQIIKFWQTELAKVLIYKPDLILLTENCDRPAGLTAEERFQYYRVRKNQVLDYFSSFAATNHCYLAFGMRREENGKWWNSSVLLDREGKVAGVYNKNFPTIDEMEAGIHPGTEVPVFQCDFGRVAATICFDLNFDELRERYEKLHPDIILFSSAYHGGLVQGEWAYSCRSFFVCSYYFRTAPSEIRNPLGEVVESSTNYYNYAVATLNLDYKIVHLDYNWDKLVALKRKYGDEVIINDPGKLGVVMITSEKKDVTAEEMIKEFKISTVDEYFDQSRRYRLEKLNNK